MNYAIEVDNIVHDSFDNKGPYYTSTCCGHSSAWHQCCIKRSISLTLVRSSKIISSFQGKQLLEINVLVHFAWQINYTFHNLSVIHLICLKNFFFEEWPFANITFSDHQCVLNSIFSCCWKTFLKKF